MKLLSYLCFVCFVESVVIGLVALALNRAPANRAAALTAFVYSIWAFGMMFVYGSEVPEVSLAFYKVASLGSLFIAPCLLWLYLLLAEIRPPIRWVCLAFSLAYSTAVLIDYLVSGFYYESFRDGPWGNVGVPSSNWFWATVTPYVSIGQITAALIVLARLRRRTASQRLRRQLATLIPAALVTCGLYFLSWLAEILWEFPTMVVLVGSVLVTTNFYLIARYRYLRRDTPLLEKHLVDIVQDSAFFLDEDRRILGANPQALKRLALSEGDLVGKDFREVLDDPALLDREWSLIADGPPHRGQPCQMGGQSVVLALSPRYDQFNGLVGVIALVGDLVHFDAKAAEAGLTAREKQVLLLTLQGRNFAEIADDLSISPATVKTHMHHMCDKTGSANRVELFARLLPS